MATIAAGVFTAGPAEARCVAGISASRNFYDSNGTLWGQEDSQVTSTCDDDGHYRGEVLDSYTDGANVYAQYTDGSYTGVQGSSSGSWSNYEFWDQTGDTRAQWRLYRGSYAKPAWVWAEGY